jgi:hypothetical protein
MEPSSSPRPSRANSNPPPRTRRRRRVPSPTLARTRPLRSTPRSGGAPTNSSRCPWRSTRSTGTRYAARTGSHSSHRDRARADCGSRADAVFELAAAARAATTEHRAIANRRRVPQVPSPSSSQTSPPMEILMCITHSFKCETALHGTHGTTRLPG